MVIHKMSIQSYRTIRAYTAQFSEATKGTERNKGFQSMQTIELLIHIVYFVSLLLILFGWVGEVKKNFNVGFEDCFFNLGGDPIPSWDTVENEQQSP